MPEYTYQTLRDKTWQWAVAAKPEVLLKRILDIASESHRWNPESGIMFSILVARYLTLNDTLLTETARTLLGLINATQGLARRAEGERKKRRRRARTRRRILAALAIAFGLALLGPVGVWLVSR